MYANLTDPSSVKDISVWIVDDHQDYREVIQDMINDTEGMHCFHAFASCEELLEQRPSLPSPGVILMDIGIPGKMSGIEGVKKLRKIDPHIRIVMLTIHSDDDKIFQAICSGASGYMLKMSEPNKILDAVREAHSGGVAMTPQVAQRVLEMFRTFSVSENNYDLTSREKEVLQLLVDGMIKKEIAEELHIAYSTVDTHIQNIYQKLHVHSNTQAVSKALRERLI